MSASAINGAATGLGCNLVLSCDFVVSSRQASYAMSYIARGLIPEGGGLYLLPRRVGLPKAKELIYTGRRVEPDEGLAIGLVEVISQSGGILGSLLSRGAAAGIGFSKLVATSNEVDLGVADFVDYLVDDDATEVIALYLEGLRDTEKFSRAALKARAR